MTILHVDSAREYRGGQNQARLLMAGLAPRDGIRQTLVAGVGSRLAAEAADLGVAVRSVPWALPVDGRALAALRAAFADDWDVVHAHDGHAVQSVLLARALAGGSSPVLAARRVDFPARRPFVWQRANLVVAVSDRIREILVGQGVDRRRIEVVYSGIDPGEVEEAAARATPGSLRSAAGASNGEALVAAVGALVGHKDHATFVRAASLVAPAHPGVRFAVFGEGPERRTLERLVAESGLDSRFVLPGEIPDIAGSLGEIDVFVMPSSEEGLGTACIEAMMAGRPIVATAAGGLRELAAGGAFDPVDPGDPAALAAEIERLLDDAEAREAAAVAARAAGVRFTAEAMVQGTLRCYGVLRRRPS